MINITHTITTSMYSFKRYLAKLSGKLPFHIILITPFVIQILLTLGLIGYLSFRNGQNISHDVVKRLHDEITTHIQHQIDTNSGSSQLGMGLQQEGLSVQMTPYQNQQGANSLIVVAVPTMQTAFSNRIILLVLSLTCGMSGVMAFLFYYRSIESLKERQLNTQMSAKKQSEQDETIVERARSTASFYEVAQKAKQMANRSYELHTSLSMNSTSALPMPAQMSPPIGSSSPSSVSTPPLTSSSPPAPYRQMINGDEYYRFLKNKSNHLFHILVVADDPVGLEMLSNHLTSHYYNVTQVATSQDALELIDGNQQFDLILLDFVMSQTSGIDVCREIRQTHSATHLPVILLTMDNQVDNLLEAFKVGANDYLTKPVPKEELLSRIKSHIHLARLTKASHRFVPHEFFKFLGKKKATDITLGDPVLTKMSVLFSDIRSFGILSKQMTAQENFKFLNAYFGRIRPVIREYNGFIDKHIGDSTMALFSGPVSDAIDGAIAIQRTIRHYNTHRAKSEYQPITVGIGLHYGNVMIGTIGENQHFESAVISPVVDLAARLERLTKLYGASILVSEQSINGLKEPERYHFRFLDKIKIKGKQQTIRVFEVLNGESEEMMEKKVQTMDEFDAALAYYYQKEFAKAKVALQNVLSINPADNAARLYNQRLAHW